MNVKTKRPTAGMLQRLADLADAASAEKPTPSVKVVVADCMGVIEKYRLNGHTWASIARDLAAEGILYAQDEGDRAASGLDGRDICEPDGTGVVSSDATAGVKKAEGRFPIKASTLRATAWNLNRELGERYNLRG